MTKTVLVTQRLEMIASYGEEREMLDAQWNTLLQKCGIFPVTVSCRISPQDYFKKLNPCGIFLTGGNDLACVNAENKLNKKRDLFESELIVLAVRKKIPVMGVCRGMQLINHFWGGTLERRSGHAGVKHRMVFGRSQRTVNSYHNFCIAELGRGLLPLATSEDGVVEAVRHRSHKILGIMWHPERNHPFQAADIKMITEFFRVPIKKSHKR